jgi:hypothetical protein
MGNPEQVSELPRPLPTEIEISGTPDVRLAPNDMRALKEETGKTLDELMGEAADETDRMQAMIWLELRRRGYRPSWDEAGDVAFAIKPEQPDPTSGAPSPSSPPSAASGA